MGIFVPRKDGDAMGDYAYQRMGKRQKREYAIAKQAEEEKTLASPEGFYARQRLSQKFNDTVKKHRKQAGLE